MKKRLHEYTLAHQIRLMYLVFFGATFGIVAILYISFILRTASDTEEVSVKYTLNVTKTGVESLIENANDFSKVAAYDGLIQDTLGRTQSNFYDTYENQVEMQQEMQRLAACCEGISSVFIFDNDGNMYYGGNIYEIESIHRMIEEVFEEMRMKNASGEAHILPINRTRSLEGEPMIFYARAVKNLETMQNIGTMALSIPIYRIAETFSEVAAQNKVEVALFDSQGELLTSTDEGAWLAESDILKELSPGSEKVLYRDSARYYIFADECGDTGITAVGAIKRSVLMGQFGNYWTITIIIFAIGLFGCIAGAAVITNRINRPLHNILQSMDQVEKGNFELIDIVPTNAEINLLQKQYNKMLASSERLMVQRVEEQRIRRKYELSLLQAQIKPHFLYNTFDSVCALAMMGRNKDVYDMMQALGQYYRDSLHKGQEIITVGEELNIVRNYLIIEKYRFGDIFRAVYDIDESVLGYRMIKLVLQPLVENAIYHGFRDHELSGTITVRAKDDEKYVLLSVEDDGYGMSEERLKEVTDPTEDNTGRRFGLYGTLARIRLYYADHEENSKLISIRSAIGEGTAISIRIPKDEGDRHA